MLEFLVVEKENGEQTLSCMEVVQLIGASLVDGLRELSFRKWRDGAA